MSQRSTKEQLSDAIRLLHMNTKAEDLPHLLTLIYEIEALYGEIEHLKIRERDLLKELTYILEMCRA